MRSKPGSDHRSSVSGRLLHIAGVLLFIGGLSLPIFQNKLSLFTVPTLSENRNLHLKPDTHLDDRSLIERIYLGGVKYTRKYEDFFNDHFGFRHLLIMLKNEIDRFVFGVSDDLLFGADGFLFQKSVIEEDLIRADSVSSEKLAEVQKNILRMHRYLQKRGIKLVTILCRERETLYPEKILLPTVKRPEITNAERYVRFFKEHPEIPFIDSLPALQRMKTNYPVFYKTDFHWNSMGAYAVSKELIPALTSLYGETAQFKTPFNVVERPGFSGTANLYLATFSTPPEVATEISYVPDSAVNQVVPPKYPADFHYRQSPRKGLLPATVFLGNSFSPYFFKIGLAEHFEEVIYVFKGHMKFQPLEKLLLPETKLVVWQFNEFDIGTFYLDPSVWASIDETEEEESSR